MKVLSLFDGISCARVALDSAGINVESYYASEIDKYAIQISSKNYPDIKQVGGVMEICSDEGLKTFMPEIDLLIGGSPCQDLSIAKANRQGLEGSKSNLFYQYVKIRDYVKPKYFILENVASMSKESKDTISKVLGVEPTLINASLVSAQNRKRLFWIGIYSQLDDKYYTVAIPQPEDRNIILKDIIQSGEVDRDKSYCIDASYYKGANWKQYKEKGRRQLVIATLDEGTWAKRYEQIRRVYSTDGLAPTIPTAQGGGVMPKIFTGESIRKLTPIECERLQSLPDNYTEGVSNTQRYKCLGNAFNVDVVAHILKYLINKG
jgi:DNA (cytosine-5)-methyltransferase 3A